MTCVTCVIISKKNNDELLSQETSSGVREQIDEVEKRVQCAMSSTIRQECETCFTEERQTTNDKACNRSHTRKVNKGDHTFAFAKKRSKCSARANKKNYSHDPTQVLSTESKTET